MSISFNVIFAKRKIEMKWEKKKVNEIKYIYTWPTELINLYHFTMVIEATRVHIHVHAVPRIAHLPPSYLLSPMIYFQFSSPERIQQICLINTY